MPRNTFSRETLKSKKCNWNAVDSICDSILDNLKNSIFLDCSQTINNMQITKKKNLLLNVSPCVLKPAWHTCFTVFNPWQLVVTPGRLWLKTTFQTTHRSCTEPCWLSLWRLKAPISTSRQFKPWKKIVQMGQSSQLNKNIYKPSLPVLMFDVLAFFWMAKYYR